MKHMSVKVRLYPSPTQAAQLAQHAGCARYVYNWGLARWKELYANGEKPNANMLSNELTVYKRVDGLGWLSEVSAPVLQQSLQDLGTAFTRFFRKQSEFPVFKKLGKTTDSFRVPAHCTVDVEAAFVKLPRLGWIKAKGLRNIAGVVKSITVSRKTDRWYASILYERPESQTSPLSTSLIGVDVGITKLATTYDGTISRTYEHSPKLLVLEKRLKTYQKRVSRKVSKSNNRRKAQLKVSRLHQRIANIRVDTLHKLSHSLCKNHAGIAIEQLQIVNMSRSAAGTLESPGTNVAQKRGLNRAIQRQGWGILFTQLAYKASWYGSHLFSVAAAYTSQTCPICGNRNRLNRPSQAVFKCVNCAYVNNADVVGAINIRTNVLQAVP